MPFNNSILNSVHGRMHRGEFYSACNSLSLGNIDDIFYLIATNNNPAHFSYSVSSSGEAYISLLKQVTVDAMGSVLVARNINDFHILSIPTTVISADAVLLNDGVKWEELLIVGGSGPQSVGDTLGSRIEEHILKPNDFYAIHIENPNVTSIKFSINMGWYEPV